MNCRRVNSLLSAYIDSELTGEEMLAVRDHLEICTECRAEQEALQQTKRLLASLRVRTPRAELEELLLVAVEHEDRRPFRRWLDGPALRPLRDAWEAVAYTDFQPTPGTLLTVMAFSVMGLWFATGVADRANGDHLHTRTGELILLSRLPKRTVVSPPTSSASQEVPAGFGTGGPVVPATYVSADPDPAQLGAGRYTPPTHLQGGFVADMGFSLSLGIPQSRAAARNIGSRWTNAAFAGR